MSILTDKLPESVVIDGTEYPLKTDFRTWIRFSNVMTSNLPITQKLSKCLVLIFAGNKLPPTLDCATELLLKFYNGSSIKSDADKGSEGGNQKRLYDYEYDAEAIYASFMQYYKIDLTTADLHWWQFKALFSSLGEGTKMFEIMQYRAVNLKKIKDKERRSFYAKMKKLYALPDNRSQEEKEQAIADALFSI